MDTGMINEYEQINPISKEKKKSEIRFLREWNKLIGIDELNQA